MFGHGVFGHGAVVRLLQQAVQQRFVERLRRLDLRRMAYLPLTTSWFPRLEEPCAGMLGRAPKALRSRLDAIALELATRRPEVLTRLGPLRG